MPALCLGFSCDNTWMQRNSVLFSDINLAVLYPEQSWHIWKSFKGLKAICVSPFDLVTLEQALVFPFKNRSRFSR